MEVILKCAVKSTIEVPDDLEDEYEVRKYLKSMYDDYELVEYPDEVIIEEIEHLPEPPDEYDIWKDKQFLTIISF